MLYCYCCIWGGFPPLVPREERRSDFFPGLKGSEDCFIVVPPDGFFGSSPILKAAVLVRNLSFFLGWNYSFLWVWGHSSKMQFPVSWK